MIEIRKNKIFFFIFTQLTLNLINKREINRSHVIANAKQIINLFIDKIRLFLNLNTVITADHYKEESLLTRNFKVCRFGVLGKTNSTVWMDNQAKMYLQMRLF